MPALGGSRGFRSCVQSTTAQHVLGPCSVSDRTDVTNRLVNNPARRDGSGPRLGPRLSDVLPARRLYRGSATQIDAQEQRRKARADTIVAASGTPKALRRADPRAADPRDGTSERSISYNTSNAGVTEEISLKSEIYCGRVGHDALAAMSHAAGRSSYASIHAVAREAGLAMAPAVPERTGGRRTT